MLSLPKIWVIINALVFIGIGLLTIVSPHVVSKAIGYKLEGPASLPELIASYGGMLLALGIILLLAMKFFGVLVVLQGMVILYAGYSIGRIIGIFLNTYTIDSTTLTYLAYEVCAGIISFLFWFFNR